MQQALIQTDSQENSAVRAAERRLKIIKRHYAGALSERLAAIYVGVVRLVGPRYFDLAALRFIAARPPRTLSTSDLGAGFAGFLATQPMARLLPYLPDVARLEWAIHVTRRAPRVPALPADALDPFRAENYCRIALFLHPSCRLVRSRYPVLEIYRRTRPDAEPWETIHAGPDGTRLLLLQTGTRVSCRGLDAEEMRFVSALLGGRTVHAARPRESFDVHRPIARLLASGAVVGYAVRGPHAA